MSLFDRLEHGWNMFKQRSPANGFNDTDPKYQTVYEPQSISPDRSIPQRFYSQSSFASMIYNRIAIDVSMAKFRHIKLSKDRQTSEVVKDSHLNRLFECEFNIDQTATDFMHDLTYSLFDEGVVAAVVVSASGDPMIDGSYNIESMRCGKIIQWYPRHVRVKLYNEETGQFSEVVVPKRTTAIIENPLNAVVGNGNPTLDRLMKKLSLLDKQDSESVSSKLNMILQLPNPVRTDLKQEAATKRVKDLENQLKESNLGIGYIGSEEKITQLNRQLNSILMDEVKYLTDELLSQLGFTRNIFNGTASSEELHNYYVRTIEPILTRIQEEFQRKFLTKTAYTQGHRVTTYNDPFRMVPTKDIANIFDTLIRNRILTSNESREILGFDPSEDPRANELFNPNMPWDKQGVLGSPASPEEYDPYMMDPELQNGGNLEEDYVE